MKSILVTKASKELEQEVIEDLKVEDPKHYRIICSVCDDLIGECRCMGEKTIIKELCRKCYENTRRDV